MSRDPFSRRRPAIGVTLDSEGPGYRFRLGARWHPGCDIARGDGAVFAAFMVACLAPAETLRAMP